MRCYSLLLCLLLVITACQQPQQEANTNEEDAVLSIDPEWEQFAAEYHDFFNALFVDAGVPGAALTIVQDGQPIFMNGYGVRTAGKSTPITKHTKFRLGSVSKTFASLTAAKVVEAGLAAWETPIVDAVPEFILQPKAQTNRISLEHILSHTSGLPPHTYTNLLEAGQSIVEIAAKLDQVKEVKPEGENFAYQNVAFALVEPFLEKNTGQSYRSLVDKYIFQPAGMENASTSLDALLNANNVSSPHRAVGKKGRYKKIRLSKKYYNAVSAGGVNASIKDMAEYLKILQGARPDIVQDSLLQKIFTPVIETNFERRYFDKWRGTKSAHYALGWRVIYYQGREIIHHGGYVNGFRTEIFIDRKEKIGACLLLNASNPLANNFVPNFFKFYDAYWAKQKAKAAADKPLS